MTTVKVPSRKNNEQSEKGKRGGRERRDGWMKKKGQHRHPEPEASKPIFLCAQFSRFDFSLKNILLRWCGFALWKWMMHTHVLNYMMSVFRQHSLCKEIRKSYSEFCWQWIKDGYGMTRHEMASGLSGCLDVGRAKLACQQIAIITFFPDVATLAQHSLPSYGPFHPQY